MLTNIHLFMFNGPPNSGKDFTASKLKERFEDASHALSNRNIVLVSSSDALDYDVATMFGLDVATFKTMADSRFEKDQKSSLLQGMSPREAKIFVAEDIIKPHNGSGYYGEKTAKIVLSKIKKGADNIVFVTGVGFDEEVDALIEGIDADNDVSLVSTSVVRLYRTGTSFENDSRDYIYRLTAGDKTKKDISATCVDEAERKIMGVILG